MNDRVEHWLSEQQAQGRPLLLVIDSLAEPTPLPSLFSTDLVHSYANSIRVPRSTRWPTPLLG